MFEGMSINIFSLETPEKLTNTAESKVFCVFLSKRLFLRGNIINRGHCIFWDRTRCNFIDRVLIGLSIYAGEGGCNFLDMGFIQMQVNITEQSEDHHKCNFSRSLSILNLINIFIAFHS